MYVLLLLIPLAMGLIAGFLLGRGFPKKKREPEIDKGKEDYQGQRFRELNQELKATREELTRKREIAAQIPIIVRMLSEKLPQSSIPGIAVRSSKNFFNAKQAGFFSPVEGTNEVVLTEGAGFPLEWKGNVRFSARDGILGMALENRVILTKDEYAACGKMHPPGPNSLEKAGVIPDLVAPVLGTSEPIGAIVVAGCAVPVNDERHYASMLADIFSSAYKNAMVIESTELSASVDALTGLFNRMYFAPWFENALRQARNYSAPLSLVMLDIDHFKRVNDTYGHPAGDLVLKKIGEILRRFTRSSNLVARYGGEEFVIVMTSSGKDQSCQCTDALREKVALLEIKAPDKDVLIRVTISAGVAGFPQDGDSTSDLIRAADDALYEAKRKGRNQVVRAEAVGLDGKPVR
ncbi:MAG: GGDEF domain-containing protein [Deltaproteobacteria bacterium]|nr:GGDEF domain-containing protein [Deltaproteobacteria bacterium]